MKWTDAVIVALEATIEDLDSRVETLEGTAADHETRLTAAESDIEGRVAWHFLM